MLRDVVVHIHNEQPVLADLLNDPAPTDVAVICSNLRTTNGKKPVFVDLGDSTFVIPLAHIRFIEIHKSSIEDAAADTEALAAEVELERAAAEQSAGEADAEADDADGGPLARLSWLDGDGAAGVEMALLPSGSNGMGEPSDEIDPELLRRIREA